jgi:Uma2 family endonuclease
MQATKQEKLPLQSWERRFNVAEYYRMAEAGILGEGRVELIEGVIVEMAAMGSRHAACVDRLNQHLNRLSGGKALVRVQSPIRLDDDSEPEPDLALLKPREDFYSSEHPGPGDILLIIEVSDTSAEYDVEIKLPLYARAGIPETWLVNLATETIEVHSGPASDGYRKTLRAKRGEKLESNSVSGLKVAAEDVLG